jgi:hypothetical protein
VPQYMLLLHESPTGFGGLSPEQIQAIIGRYRSWGQNLRTQGRMVSGAKLRSGEGRLLRLNGSKPLVADGPYAESKEVIGGYYTIVADDYNHAVETAKECPHVDFGTIEIREVEIG